jgi:hypothetical protein
MRSLPPTAALTLAVAVALALAGCGDLPEPESDTHRVVVSLSVLPSDVQCLRITAAGPSRTAVKEVEVMAGSSFSEALTGLPLGRVEFRAEAFSPSCGSVTRSTHAGWLSEPVEANVVIGRQTSVALTMHRNGRAKVGIEFVDDLPAPDAGARD